MYMCMFTCKWRIPFGSAVYLLIVTVAVVTSYDKNIII